QLLRDAAQPLVQPRLLEGARAVSVDPATGVDQVLQLVPRVEDRGAAGVAHRAHVAVDASGGVGNEHVDDLPLVTAFAAARRGGEQVPATELRAADRRAGGR